MFVVLSAFTGLKNFGLSFSNMLDPDIRLLPAQGKVFHLSDSSAKELAQFPEVHLFSSMVEEQVLLNYRQKDQIALLRGVDPNYPMITAIDSVTDLGRWLAEPNETVVGWGIGRNLGLGILSDNEFLEVIVPKLSIDNTFAVGKPYHSVSLLPVGAYALSDEEDSKYLFCDIHTAQELLKLEKGEVSSIEIMMKPDVDEAALIEKIIQLFKNQVIVKNREQLNDALYRMLNTENIAIYLIFILILIIAFFNVIGSIIMMVLDKKSNLRTLFHVGANIGQLKRIFLFLGLSISLAGGISGILLGVLLVGLQDAFGIIMITRSLPYPVEFSWSNLGLVLITIFVLGLIAAYIASRRVNRRFVAGHTIFVSNLPNKNAPFCPILQNKNNP